MRVATSGYRMIAVCLVVVVAGFGLLAVDVWAEESLAKFDARVEAALAAAESALASEESRLDELAAHNSRRTLANGRPSVAQAAANVRLWERRIQELEAGEQTSRGELNDVLGSLGADIAALAQRLSARHEQVEREKAEREKQELERAEQEQRAREKAERERVEREKAEREKRERERRAREKAERERAVGHVFRDCPDCPEMVVVPSGDFMMGSPPDEERRGDDEGPQHRVTIGYRFAVGVHEVTRGEFARFVRATNRAMGNSCRFWNGRKWQESGINWRNPGFSQSADHPVVCVSWNDAAAYVRWLSQQTGKAYRLLSESEWEYVARAGTSMARYWGESASGQCRYENGADASTVFDETFDYRVHCNDGYVQTAPVGSYDVNGFGLHDVLGNVEEWVQDCWNDSYQGAPTDGRAWENGDCRWRVVRGGSWFYDPRYLRSASRDRNGTGSRLYFLGFRVTRTLAP